MTREKFEEYFKIIILVLFTAFAGLCTRAFYVDEGLGHALAMLWGYPIIFVGTVWTFWSIIKLINFDRKDDEE
ncbi:MAG: hypothetical protein R3D86_13795 [Emcibacteraceae bacterium]